MSNLIQVMGAIDVTVPRREISSLNTEGENTQVAAVAIFYPVYASPDDVDFQRKELFEPQFLPR